MGLRWSSHFLGFKATLFGPSDTPLPPANQAQVFGTTLGRRLLLWVVVGRGWTSQTRERDNL